MTILAFRGGIAGLGDTTANPAPSALQTQVTTLVDAVTEMLGTAQSTLSDLAASGLDDTTHALWQQQLDAIAQEVAAVQSSATAMGTAEANDAIVLLRDDQQQLANMRDKFASLRTGLTEGISLKTLGWGLGAVAAASAIGYWLISRRRERRRARRLKKKRGH